MTALEASQVDAETKSAGRGVPSRTPAGPLLRLDQVQAATVVEQPFRHIVGVNVVDAGQASAIDRDFPDIRKSGFFVTEDLEDCGPAMQALLDEIAAPEFSRIVGEKLGLDLVGRPQMAMVRKWSGPRDGRPHTDGLDKAATALIYLNDHWDGGAGALRYLEGPDVDGPGTEAIPPVFGVLTAFARSDTSWHGHPTFVGERRVIQLFWMVDEAAAGRKKRRHKRQSFWRFLRPALKENAVTG
jgi:hypothetical protein